MNGSGITYEDVIIGNERRQFEEAIKKIEELEKIIKKAAEVLGEYTTYSSPTNEQLRKNDSIVDKTYDILAPEELEVCEE